MDGAAPTMGLTRRYLASSDTNLYFTGDVVVLSTAIPGFIGLPSSGVNTGSTGAPNPILGIFAGCEFFSPTVGRVIWSANFPGNTTSSSPCNAYVIEDPNQLFTVQGTTTTVLGTSAIGLNIGFTSTGALGIQSGGNLTTGISNVALASSTATLGGAGLAFRIVDTSSGYAPPGVNGADGTTAGAIMVVAFNNQLRRSLTVAST